MSEALESQNSIAKWLEGYGFKIWFDRKNPWNYPTFTGSSSKFDLLVQKNNNFSAIEVKTGDDDQDLLNGFQQIIKYAGEYYSGKSIYFVNGSEVKINEFLFATKYSNKGYLYKHESDTTPITGRYLSEVLNQGEYLGSLVFSRLLHRMWNNFFTEYYGRERIGSSTINIPSKPKVGIIVAKYFWQPARLSKEPYFYLSGNTFENKG